MLTYLEALKKILERTDFERGPRPPYKERVYRLDRVEELLSALGSPQKAYRCVHVAGTKGKGSTSAMIASMLASAGYLVGLYTSPHLHTFRERMRVGDDLISEAELIGLVEQMAPVLGERPEVTVFEIITALAMLFFGERGVDWAVFEVGLGGRLDATNVIEPEVSVISSISLDHTQVLGDTLAKIAREKAGIIKAGVPVVSADQHPEAMAVIEQVARERKAPLTVVGRDWHWSPVSADDHGQSICVAQKHAQPAYPELSLDLLGEHQAENACLAVAAIETLRQADVEISRDAVAKGLATVRWPGRLEVLGRGPLVVVDGAHNGDSMRRLLAAVQRHFAYGRLLVVMGVSAGHQPAELVGIAADHADKLILTQSRHPRAVDPRELLVVAEERHCSSRMMPTIDGALEVALDSSQSGDLVLLTGSLFVVAEARTAWFGRRGLPMPPTDPSGAY